MRVLVVEDEQSLASALDRGLTKLGYAVDVAYDGAEALDKAGDTSYDVVCLDLNLPRKRGREVLEDVKNDPDLLSIPIVVMTTSEAEGDILNSYYHHANAYVTKPVDFDRFIDVVNKIEGFWLTVAKLPPE